MQKLQFQLYDAGPGSMAGEIIRTTGGTVYLSSAGAAAKLALFNKDGSTLANPVSMVGGGATVYVADSVNSVDVYGISGGGHAFVKKSLSVGAGGADIMIDRQARQQELVIPFSKADTAAATETDTGFDLPANAAVSPFLGISVLTLESAKTIDFGLLSSESGGDADGFCVAASLAAAGVVMVKSASTATRGALVGAGTLDRPMSTDLQTSKSISYTLSSGTTVAAGFLMIPYTLNS